jgi:hypothetical protein
MKKKIIVGLDFDGVVAYNPARLARFPISFIKHHVFGVKKVQFFVPKTAMQRALWALVHETSMFPSQGATLLRHLTQTGQIEAHLVTARFGYLEKGLMSFLRRWDLLDCFTSITLNTKEEQPHIFKARIIRSRKFSYYIEDNWDIVSYLSSDRVKTEVHWIYNIIDRNKVYSHKYPYLQKSLERIMALNNFKAQP